MSDKPKQSKKRNPIAKVLRDPLFRKRVVKDKTNYNRHRIKLEDRRDANGDPSFYDYRSYEV